MNHARNWIALLLVLIPATLLAGCGGGGGNNPGGGGPPTPNTYYGSITGKVVDTSGNPVPTAVVLLDSTTQGSNVPEATTVNNGGYLLSNITPGLHTVYVSTSVGSPLVGYTGRTQVQIYNTSNNNVTNANIIVALPAQQATISGTVTDSTNHNAPVPNAEVFFQSTFSNSNTSGLNSSTSPLSTASLVAYTGSNGTYTITLPVYQGTGTTPRAYTASAGYQTGDPTSSFGNSALQNGLTYAAGATVNNVNFALANAQGANNATPTINDIEAITEPIVPAFYTPGQSPSAAAAASAESGSVYEQIHKLLSPNYSKLVAQGHAAANVKHLISAAQSHTSALATDYGVEMDLFFSLPGDSAGVSAPVRQQLSGFQISTDAGNTGSQTGIQPIDFLQDPLANFYDYQDINSSQLILFPVDEAVNFSVQSYLSDGQTPTGNPSNEVAVAPLSFVNMVQPADPLYNNQTIGTLPATSPVIQWTVYDASTHISNYNVADYYVFLYSTFPGVTTTPMYTSGAQSVSTTYNVNANVNSFTIPNTVTLTSGHQYWVVVAATASSSPSSSSTALSFGQITPFNAQ
jgi:hypothetical protein